MTHFDLVVIGTGSGNSIVDDEFSHLKIAIVEKGLFGGTCLNVGCIPTKMYVHAADVARDAKESAHLGVSTSYHGFDFQALQHRIFGRIDAIEADGRAYRSQRLENVTVFPEHVHFTGPKSFETTSGITFTAERVVIATGSYPTPLEVPGLDWERVDSPGYPVVTSDTVMRLDYTPQRMVIVGSGFIAAEFAHVFASLGVDVTVVVRRDHLLSAIDTEISQSFSQQFAARINTKFGLKVDQVDVAHGSTRVHLVPSGLVPGAQAQVLEADTVLVAIGRTRASASLLPENAGLDLAGDRILVDEYQRVLSGGKVLPGVYALGDVCSPYLLKHVANHEARVVRANLLTEMASGQASPSGTRALAKAQHSAVPAAVFSRPQVAMVGLTEKQAQEAGIDTVTNTHPYAAVAYGWALDDNDSFVKVIADRSTQQIVGAHILGPEASTLIQTFIHAMSFHQPAHVIARGQYWIHPALTEVVENALLGLKFENSLNQ